MTIAEQNFVGLLEAHGVIGARALGTLNALRLLCGRPPRTAREATDG